MRRRLYKRDPAGFGKRLNQVLDARDDCGPVGDGRGVWLAERYSVRPSSTFAWIHGESLPMPERRPMIAQDLGVNPDWLYYGVGEMLYTGSNPTAVEAIGEEPSASHSVRIHSVKLAAQVIDEVWGKEAMRLLSTTQHVDVLLTIAKWLDAGLSWDNVLQFARHTFPVSSEGNDGRQGGSSTHQANAR